jgi:GT2 family glycosyltransferase
LIRNDENLGFPRANNQGIEVARGDYVLLLNSDTIITGPTIFRRWIAFMDENPDVGFSGCRLVFRDGTHQVGDAGYRPKLSTLVAHNLFLNRLFPRVFKGLMVSYRKSPGRIEVDWICGADLLVRRSIIPETGSLDETIFIYAEDVEWGCRMRSHGYHGYYLPDLELIHLQGATTNQYPDQFSGMDLKNMRLIYSALNPRQSLFLYDLIMSIGFLSRAVLYTLMFWKPGEFRHSRSSRMFKYFKFSVAHFGKPAA